MKTLLEILKLECLQCIVGGHQLGHERGKECALMVIVLIRVLSRRGVYETNRLRDTVYGIRRIFSGVLERDSLEDEETSDSVAV